MAGRPMSAIMPRAAPSPRGATITPKAWMSGGKECKTVRNRAISRHASLSRPKTVDAASRRVVSMTVIGPQPVVEVMRFDEEMRIKEQKAEETKDER